MNPPMRPASSLSFWFTDLRGIALIASVTCVFRLPVPIWNAVQTSTAAIAPKNDFWTLAWILILVLLILFSAIIPVFYFVLYRNQAPLRFPKRLRLLALIAAFTFAVIVLTTLPAWIRSVVAYLAAFAAFDWSIGGASVLALIRDPRTIGQLSTVLGELSNIAGILMLIAIFRCANEPLETGVPVSKQLRIMTKVAVVAWRVVLVVILVRLAALPFVFFETRNYALQIGRTPPTFRDMLEIRLTLQLACLFAVPYIIYKSQRERSETPVDAHSGPELIESGG